MANRLGRALGWLWYWCIPVRLRVARRNLERALGGTKQQRNRILRACCAHQALYAVDVLRAPLMTPARSDHYVERSGFEHLERALAAGRGAIVFMAHYGSLDLIGFSQAIRGLPMIAVVKELGWGPANRYVQHVRQLTGLQLLPPRRSREACLAALRRNMILGLIVDQHMPPHRGIVCSFFNRPASTTPAPVRFAYQSGAPIFGAVIRRKGLSPYHHFYITPELQLESPHEDHEANVRHNTQRINNVVEGWVREDPAQWLWMHRRWKVDGEPAA